MRECGGGMNLRLLLLLLWLAPLGAAYALSTDKTQPIDVSADSVELDDKAGRAVYRGRVRVTQGTMRITGDTLVLERKDGAIHMVTVTGNPATYRQRPDGEADDVTAEAGVLQILPLAGVVRLEKNAQVRQRGRAFSGQRIEYDNQNDIVRADGADAATPGGRVRIVIPPE